MAFRADVIVYALLRYMTITARHPSLAVRGEAIHIDNGEAGDNAVEIKGNSCSLPARVHLQHRLVEYLVFDMATVAGDRSGADGMCAAGRRIDPFDPETVPDHRLGMGQEILPFLLVNGIVAVFVESIPRHDMLRFHLNVYMSLHGLRMTSRAVHFRKMLSRRREFFVRHGRMAVNALLCLPPRGMNIVTGFAFQALAGMHARLMLLDGIPVAGRALGFLQLLRVRQVLRVPVAGNTFELRMVHLLVLLMTINTLLRCGTQRE
jgi:hypothetical protein